jgi:hypothetical protein
MSVLAGVVRVGFQFVVVVQRLSVAPVQVYVVPPHAATVTSAVAKNAAIKTEKIFFIVVFLYVKREFVAYRFLVRRKKSIFNQQ